MTTTWKSMYGELERDDNLVFESCYNSHTLYRNLSKRFETCKERSTLQTHWNLQGACYSTNTLKPARSVVLYKHVVLQTRWNLQGAWFSTNTSSTMVQRQVFCFITWQPPHWEAMHLVWSSPGNIHQYPVYVKISKYSMMIIHVNYNSINIIW